MRYFDQWRTVDAIKKAYKKLAFLHHPDRGGDTDVMQEINRQYQAALKAADGQRHYDDQGNERTYTYNEELEQALADKIDELIRSGILGTVQADLIGTWIWLGGDTKPAKDTIKELGFRWSRGRSLWYWHTGGFKKKGWKRTGASMVEIAAKYGSSRIHQASLT